MNPSPRSGYELRRIHQAEQDRLLDNKSKAAAIVAARWAKVAASISLLSVILSMLQWLMQN